MQNPTIPLIDFIPSAAAVRPDGALEIPLSSHNWSGQYPYAPTVTVRLWHTGSEVCVAFAVDERSVRAMATEDQGEVWKDSCVEWFLTFGDWGYYNIEANCCGKILMAHRRSRKVYVKRADGQVLQKIRRYATITDGPFDSRHQSGLWHLTLVIPADAFFADTPTGLSGRTIRANFYKCGDMLLDPHYMSWQPIGTATPDFHRPEFFGTLRFE